MPVKAGGECKYYTSVPLGTLNPSATSIREKKISLKQYTQIKSAFLADIRDKSVLPIDPIVIKKSITAIEKSPLKALDVTHIG